MDNLHFDGRTGQLRVVKEKESVITRIRERLWFRVGEWFLDADAGVPPLAAESVITSAILSVDDVTGVRNATFQVDSNRSAFYSAHVDTVYGTIELGPFEVLGP